MTTFEEKIDSTFFMEFVSPGSNEDSCSSDIHLCTNDSPHSEEELLYNGCLKHSPTLMQSTIKRPSPPFIRRKFDWNPKELNIEVPSSLPCMQFDLPLVSVY